MKNFNFEIDCLCLDACTFLPGLQMSLVLAPPLVFILRSDGFLIHVWKHTQDPVGHVPPGQLPPELGGIPSPGQSFMQNSSWG